MSLNSTSKLTVDAAGPTDWSTRGHAAGSTEGPDTGLPKPSDGSTKGPASRSTKGPDTGYGGVNRCPPPAHLEARWRR